jgi:hypothetical protein
MKVLKPYVDDGKIKIVGDQWVDGWLPIDTYNKSVDEVCNEPLHYDWEALRAALIENKGMRFSSLVAHMPTESCLAENEKIQTEQGDMTIKDYFLKTSGVDFDKVVKDWEPNYGGDWYDVKNPIRVNTRHGYKDVKRVFYTGLVDIMELTLEDGKKVKCTMQHKFLVRDEDGTETWKMAMELKEGDDVVQIKE